MLCDFLAGWMSGMMAFVTGHPIDTIKVQQQIKEIGAMKATGYIYKIGGLKGFYRGLSFPLFSNGVLNSAFFGVYASLCDYLVNRRMQQESEDNFRKEGFGLKFEKDPLLQNEYHKKSNFKPTGVSTTSPLSSWTKETSYTEMFIAGSLSGLCQIVIAAPIDLVKVKLQGSIRQNLYKGPVDVIKKILNASGIRGLYHGAPAMALRESPCCGLWVMSFAFLNKDLKSRGVQDTLSQFIAGGCAGMFSWWFVMPFDVIKSKMQADNLQHPVYKSMAHCAKRIWKKRGIRGLFHGFWSASLRAFPVSATSFVTYQFFQRECRSFKTTIEDIKTKDKK